MTTDLERGPLPAAPVGRRAVGAGSIGLALLSAALFATSGPFGKALLDAGWSPGAAVTVRITTAGLILLVPSIIALRGRWGLLRTNAGMVAVYGVLAVAGCQLFYFNAVRTLSVGVALLLEYLGLVLVVGWNWFRDRRPPSRATLLGVVLAVAGLVLVLDVAGDATVDVVGVLWGIGAAVGLATFFVLSANETSGLPPITMAGSGMLIGAAVLAGAGAVGVLPFEWATDDVVLAGSTQPWWVSVLGISVLAGAGSYATGIAAARRLGSKLAAFVGLTEVVFAVLFAWLLLDQTLAPIQLAGGVLIVAGVAVVRADGDEDDEPAVGVEPLPDPVVRPVD